MHVVVLTGAGVSAESGIPTFRDSNGLWENHRVEEVATPTGWMENPELVWRFYQERRAAMVAGEGIQPNAAHFALADLEKKLNEAGAQFTLITQNIDGLHLMAGSENVIEMHGTLRTLRCQKCHHTVEGYDYLDHDFLSCDACGFSMMRPDVVWFDEIPKAPERFMEAVNTATHFVSIGTSGEVYPAAGFIHTAHFNGADVYYVNLERASPIVEDMATSSFYGKATVVVPTLCDHLLGLSRGAGKS